MTAESHGAPVATEGLSTKDGPTGFQRISSAKWPNPRDFPMLESTPADCKTHEDREANSGDLSRANSHSEKFPGLLHCPTHQDGETEDQRTDNDSHRTNHEPHHRGGGYAHDQSNNHGGMANTEIANDLPTLAGEDNLNQQRDEERQEDCDENQQTPLRHVPDEDADCDFQPQGEERREPDSTRPDADSG